MHPHAHTLTLTHTQLKTHILSEIKILTQTHNAVRERLNVKTTSQIFTERRLNITVLKWRSLLELVYIKLSSIWNNIAASVSFGSSVRCGAIRAAAIFAAVI
jgi:hypothetical protein